MCRITGYSSDDTVAAQNGSRRPADVDRLASVVELAEADLLRTQTGAVLEPSQLQRQQQAPCCNSTAMSTSLAWVSWNPATGLPNCVRSTAYAIAVSQAVPGRTENAPHDAEPGLGQAGQRALEAPHLGQHRVVRQPDTLEDHSEVTEARIDSLCLISGRGEPGRVRRHEEAAHAVVGDAPRRPRRRRPIRW